MGIGGITSASSMSGMQMTTVRSADQKSKKIQDEITSVEQQIQKVSSQEELSAREKASEKEKLQKEKSSLDTELKQHQEELRRSQEREALLAELRKDREPEEAEKTEGKPQADGTTADQAEEKKLPIDEQQAEKPGTVIANSNDGIVILKEAINSDESQGVNHGVDAEKKPVDEAMENDTAKKEAKPVDNDTPADTGFSHQEMQAIMKAGVSAQQAGQVGTIITKTNDGIAILKGEMKQDERRGVDTERKQADLEKMKKTEERASAIQLSILGQPGNTAKSAAETNVVGIKDRTQDDAENNAYIRSLKISQEQEQASRQRFYVSFG